MEPQGSSDCGYLCEMEEREAEEMKDRREECRRIYTRQKRREKGQGSHRCLNTEENELAVWAHRVIRTGDGLSWEKCRALAWPEEATGSMNENSYNFYIPTTVFRLTRVYIPRRSDIHCIEVNAIGRSSVCVRMHAP